MPGSSPILPPARLGMLGGGQLGRYALMAARTMGYGTVVVDPDPSAPAGRIADVHLVAAYDSPGALDELAGTCAVVTTEFENPPAAALERLARSIPVHPSPGAVAIAQDRLAEKTFLHAHDIATAPFAALVNDDDVDVVAGLLGGPAIVKTTRLGYDGKGQLAVRDAGDRRALRDTWSALGRVACIVEQRVDLDVEVSVLVARTALGAEVTYPVAENYHADGILDLTVVPARLDARLAEAARTMAVAIADALAYVGVLAVEMFVSGGQLLVNEMAPRPHNSGHWTLDAAATSQFEQQIRAVCGVGLGSAELTVPAAAMVNLLGDRWAGGEPDWSSVLADPDAHLHLYGKQAPRPARKMGHLTVVGPSSDAVVADARALAATVGSR
ncbi:MAG: 5-(carboxyamino)imidazole ribonucleotide synthase [Desertimonas sp.]